MAINISLAINFLASAGAERGDDKMIIVTAGAIHEQIVALARAAWICGRMTVQDHDRVDEYPQETVDNINLLSQGGPP
jgi:hypothetical protein